jgi:hypothetical protein
MVVIPVNVISGRGGAGGLGGGGTGVRLKTFLAIMSW